MHRLCFSLVAAGALCGGCAQTHPALHPDGPAGPHASWERTQGGVLPLAAAEPARRALERVSSDLAGTPLRVFLLNTREPVAYSFPDGSIYLSAGLARALTDDQLAAVIAHELGHLLHEQMLGPPAALRGAADLPADIESAADDLGRRLLIAHGIPPTALADALDFIADRSRNTRYYSPVHARAQRQHALDRQP